ncbi:hypothetical protein BGX28_004262 [Mortierella sp. GBA30]|nr:hypothetical protein BGX28_004262 [Mortierella sp. GBA30]
MTPTIRNQKLPYPEEETDYQDHTGDSTSFLAPSRTGSRPASFYSFISFSSTRSNTPSRHSKKSSRSWKSAAKMSTSAETTTIALRTQRCEEKHTSEHDQAQDVSEQGDLDSLQDYDYETSIRPYQKPLYRRKRFWWTCILSTVIFMAIFIPLLLIVIIPKIAQAVMNASTMEIVQMNMTNPQERSVQVSVEAAIVGIPSIFAATVEFKEPVQVFWVRGGEPGAQSQPRVGQMSLGTIEKRAFAKAEFSQQTIFEIADPALFAEFAKVMMASESFLWRIAAKIDVRVLGRNIKDLSLDKSLNLSGLRNFANLKILSFDIPSDAPNGAGALVSIKVSIPNPSPIGMSLGTMEIDMNLKTAYLGRITAKEVVLVGGQPTILTLEGMIRKQTDLQALQELSQMITNYLANNPTTAYGQGVSVLPDGKNAVSWITSAIVSTKMTIPLLPPTPMNVIKAITIKDLDLHMTPQQPWAPTAASSGIAAAFQLPFNLSLNITNIWDPKMTLGYQGTPMADIGTAVWNRTNSDMVHNNISFTLPPSPLPIRDNAHDTFTKFLVAVTQHDSAMFEILGSAQSVASTSLGQVNITVPFNTSLPLKGINFGKMAVQLNGIMVTGATVDYVILNATVNLINPSIFNVDIGTVTLHIAATIHGMTEYIGEVMIPSLKLAPGPNPIQASVHIQPKNAAFTSAFFTEYIRGTNFEASIYGDANSSAIVSLAQLTESLKMSTMVPGMSPAPKLVIGGNGNTTVGQFLNNHQVMLQVQILNPLPTTLWMHQLSANVTWRGFSFGTIQVTQSFSIKPSGIDTSPVIAIQIPSSYQFWIFMITSFLPQNLGVLTGATVVVDLSADIKATIDGTLGSGYETMLRYAQDQVGVFLKIEFSLAGLGIGGLRKVKREYDDDDITEVLNNDLLGPEPDREDGSAYLAWLKRAVQLSYPEESAREESIQIY